MASCLEAKTRSIGKHPFCTLGQNLQKKLYFKTIIKTIDTFAHELELDFFLSFPGSWQRDIILVLNGFFSKKVGLKNKASPEIFKKNPINITKKS